MANATEELRRLLDERGVEWRVPVQLEGSEFTRWNGADGTVWTASAISGSNGKTLRLGTNTVTPAQAVRTTLGHGECRLTRETGSSILWGCDECGSYHEHLSEYPWEFCPRCGRKAVKQ